MDQKSLELLEFHKVRELLAGFASFPASRQLALALQPSSDHEAVTLSLRQSTEARRLLSMRDGPCLGTAFDVREAAVLASKAKVLEPADLTRVQVTLSSARNLRATLSRLADELPELWNVAGGIVPLADLEEEIERCITPAGEVSDFASTELSLLRRRLRETRQRILERLQSITKSSRAQRFLQEPIITERDGRYVLPIKVEMRKEFRGIVHDVSGSGATVFVEPWATAEMGNELRQLALEERREVERILSALSARVGANEPEISASVSRLAEVDLALAKARYAAQARAVEPQVVPPRQGPDAGPLRLVNARHPLLKGKPVPLTVEIGRDFTALVITGPNTGGKTVALKTLGLLALMAQAGLPVPASEASMLPVFDNVFADIGDEQSIEQTLSTFSWHMGNIVRIIRESSRCSLVLFDELAASTNPAEGAALARAVLGHLLSRGTLTVATTHYHELKAAAHSTPGMQNASLDFDPLTLLPTYHLTVGVPGGSNAMAIAAGLGLPPEVIASARGYLDRGPQEMEALLRDLQEQRDQAAKAAQALERERRQAEARQAEVEQETTEMEVMQRQELQSARDKVARETACLLKMIKEAAAELGRTRSREKLASARKTVEAVHQALDSNMLRSAPPPAGTPPAQGLSAGDRVWLGDVGLWGTVLSVDQGQGKVEVQAGSARLQLGLRDVEKAPAAEQALAPAEVRKVLSSKGASLELDLRGKRADEVEPELDAYLNSAFMSHLPQVRLIHGAATGTVRQIVRDMLSRHPLVKTFRPGGRNEGGNGVTIATLSLHD